MTEFLAQKTLQRNDALGGKTMKLHKITAFDSLDTRKLMGVYRESNTGNIDYFYPEMTDRPLALQKVEQRFLDFIKTDFFQKKGTNTAFWKKKVRGSARSGSIGSKNSCIISRRWKRTPNSERGAVPRGC